MPLTKRTVVTKDELEVPDQGQDPLVAALRSFLLEGGPLPEEVESQEFKIKVQRLDRRGRAIQGVSLQTDKVDTLFDEVLDELGPGRYTVWCNYRKVGSEKWKLIKVEDVQVEDPGADLGATGLSSVAPPPYPGRERDSREDRKDILQVMLLQMQETTKMMMAQQAQMTQILVAALGKGSGSDSIIEAIRTGAELAGLGSGESGEDEDLPSTHGGLISFANRVMDLLIETKEDQIPAAKVRQIAQEAGVESSLREQGLESVEQTQQ